MNYLLDEQLHEVVAESLNPLAASLGDSFTHILSLREPGTPDGEIPDICRSNGFACLITANVRDFGARKVYYQALIANGIHVAVLRPGHGVKSRPNVQVAFLADSLQRLHDIVSFSSEPCLMSCTHSGVRVRTIDDLIAEFDKGTRLP